MKKIVIKIGHKVNMLTVIKELSERVRPNGKTRRVFLCQCDCGVEKEILFQSLSSKRTFSCGCHQKKVVSQGSFAKTHGLSNHPLFTVWKRMIDRCYNKNHKGYKNYGERGIEMCPEWKDSSERFVEWGMKNGYKKGLQIDRENNNGNYEPSNCRFVTPLVNLMNRRPYKKRKQ